MIDPTATPTSFLEIEDEEAFLNWIATPAHRLPAAIQNLDLRRFQVQIRRTAFPHSLFLGCELDPETAGHVVATGGILIPNLEEFRFELHRSTLYRPEELFDGFDQNSRDGYQQTVDYRIYEQYLAQGKRTGSMKVSLARSLHDHSITAALDEFVRGRRVVAIMGGHGVERRSETYLRVARIARALCRMGYLVATGGGPGAMEAAHLGAFFSARDDRDLDDAIGVLGVRPEGGLPDREYADWDWLHRGIRVRQRWPIPTGAGDRCTSVGIPTWFFGHEPPAPFPTHIAKYFANSIREDGLLGIALHGVIFAPGSAGTIQEIFQDATQNHYRTEGVASPMILLGVDYWTVDRPVWPLLQASANGLPYRNLMTITDDEDEVLRRIRAFVPDS